MKPLPIILATAFLSLTGSACVEAATVLPVPPLGAPVTFGSYTMTLPNGYGRIAPPAIAQTPGGNRDYEYKHAPLANGTTPIVMVSLFAQSPNDSSSAALDDVLAGETDQIKKGVSAFTMSLIDRMTIGGLPFEHLLFRAQLPSTHGPVAFGGSSYAGQDGRTFIVISFLDIGTQSPDLARAASAAMMTFHKSIATIQP